MFRYSPISLNDLMRESVCMWDEKDSNLVRRGEEEEGVCWSCTFFFSLVLQADEADNRRFSHLPICIAMFPVLFILLPTWVHGTQHVKEVNGNRLYIFFHNLMTTIPSTKLPV
jgi:hypothetical protein